MSEQDVRKTAEKHWEYTKGLIEKSVESLNIVNVHSPLTELHHYLYIEAFIHGYKHREDDGEEV